MLDIALLGTGGSMPMPNRFLSSLLLKFMGRKVLVDCGEGTQVSMRILKWGFKSIDIICITHNHGDHIYGLPGLLLTIGNSGRTEPILIMGPKGISKSMNGFMQAIGYLPYEVRLFEVSNESIMINFASNGAEIIMDSIISGNVDFVISSLELRHSAPCIGFSFYMPRHPKFNPEKAIIHGVPKNLWKNLQRGETVEFNQKTIEPKQVLEGVRKGIKLSYITDTRPIDAIPGFIRGSDLFVCEATYGNDDLSKAMLNQHMTFSEAAKLALEGNVKELLLTHFNPAMEEPEIYIENAIKIFPNTITGYDRYTKTLGFEKNN